MGIVCWWSGCGRVASGRPPPGSTPWEKGIAPSDELRRWYGHGPAKWAAFQARYECELATPEAQAILDALAEQARQGTITLLYAARDGAISNAAVLQRVAEG